jgi:3-deoxy-7-phosphoheptulonate synthase
MILSFGSAPKPHLLETACRSLEQLGLEHQVLDCARATLIVVTDDVDVVPAHFFSQLAGIEKIIRLGGRHPLTLDQAPLEVSLGIAEKTVICGGHRPPLIVAGPCSVESREHILETARAVRASGAVALRGGAFKPRTSPYDFQGLGLEAVKYLHEASQSTGMPVISEVMTIEQIEPCSPYLDVFQVGARNMYNYELLKELGRQPKPVLLKRGMSATLDELLQAAEYILSEGNLQVILCERGIRTFEPKLRNTLDLSAVPVLKSLTNLPVVVDPSHALGKRAFVRAMSRAAIACGADGLLLESHLVPDLSISDAAQAITPDTLSDIVQDTKAIWTMLQGQLAQNTGSGDLEEAFCCPSHGSQVLTGS